MEGGIGIAEVIRQLRGDLNVAAWHGKNAEPRFELGEIELEFEVVLDTSRGGDAKARLWVVDASWSGKKGKTATHRVKLTLQPQDSEGRKTTVSGRALDREERPHDPVGS